MEMLGGQWEQNEMKPGHSLAIILQGAYLHPSVLVGNPGMWGGGRSGGSRGEMGRDEEEVF